ncbi:MAG: M23 family metallopeptidase [Bdellovibrionales bacterium]|nr:M23 family metallopeptidase [Bdellovibrionales bacterium]
MREGKGNAMRATGSIFSAFHCLVFVLGLLTAGCATGHGRRVVSSREDRIPAKQSSYRIRGTDETGVLTVVQKKKLQARTRAWRWPTNEVVVTSRFGSRGKEHHDGIDLRALSGTPVSAAADGKVIYAGARIRGYGRMVVIRHDSRLSTIYAHNSRLLVSTGQRVRRGQRIALSGSTGHSTGPHVHFEVREGVTAIDPLLLLPSPAVANEANRRMARATARPVRRPAARYSQSSSRHMAARLAEDDGFRPRSPRAARPN